MNQESASIVDVLLAELREVRSDISSAKLTLGESVEALRGLSRRVDTANGRTEKAERLLAEQVERLEVHLREHLAERARAAGVSEGRRDTIAQLRAGVTAIVKLGLPSGIVVGLVQLLMEVWR